MIKYCLVAAAAFGIMTGAACAQTTSTTSTQTTTSMPSPVVGSSIDSSSQRTVDSNGVVTDKTKTYSAGTTITPSGDLATTKKTSETTTVR